MTDIYAVVHGSSVEAASQGNIPPHLLLARMARMACGVDANDGDTIDWSNTDRSAVNWDDVDWTSVNWNSVNWNSAQLDGVFWAKVNVMGEAANSGQGGFHAKDIDQGQAGRNLAYTRKVLQGLNVRQL